MKCVLRYETIQGLHAGRIANTVALVNQQLRHAKKPTFSTYPSNGNRIQCDGSEVGAQEFCGNICKQTRLKRARGLRAEMYTQVGLRFHLKFFFFFFHWHYSPLWSLACRTMSFHFFPICHQLSPYSHFQHLKISFYFLLPSLSGSSTSSRPFQFLSEDHFGASCPPPFSLGDLPNLSFALLSILLYFLLYSFFQFSIRPTFTIPRFHIQDKILLEISNFIQGIGTRPTHLTFKFIGRGKMCRTY